MINWLTDIVLAVAFGSKQVAVMLISMVPIIELKGGIPVGIKLGMSQGESFWYAFLGSSLIAIPLLLILKPLFGWAKKRKRIGDFFTRIENVFKSKAPKLEETAEASSPRNTIWKIIAIFLFAAIPVPGTGVWTSCFIAVLIGLRLFWSLGAIILGNLAAGSLILSLTNLVGEKNLDTFLLVLFALVVVMLVLFFYKVFTQKPVSDVPNQS